MIKTQLVKSQFGKKNFDVGADQKREKGKVTLGKTTFSCHFTVSFAKPYLVEQSKSQHHSHGGCIAVHWVGWRRGPSSERKLH